MTPARSPRMSRHRSRRPPACLAAAAAFLAACAGGPAQEEPKEPEKPLRIETIKLVTVKGANDNTPVQVDLVRVRDAFLLPELLKTETRAWFAEGRDKFRNAHPDAHIDSWELVPGTVVGPADIELDGDVAGVLFCGLMKVGEENAGIPQRVARDGDLIVTIGDTECVVGGGEPSREKSGWLGALAKGVAGAAVAAFDFLVKAAGVARTLAGF